MRSQQSPRPRWKVLVSPARENAIDFEPEPETICYRGQTLAIVRHFFELSCQMGRLPSILGREFFRAKVSHHAIPSFEDQALFTHDVQQNLAKLNDDAVEVLTLVGLYDLTQEQAAQILHRSVSCINRRYGDAVAELTQLFLDSGLIRRTHPDRRQEQLKHRKLPRFAGPGKKPCGSVRHQTKGHSAQA